MSANSPNLAEILMTPGDPAVANAWGTNLNSNFSIVDLVGGGTLALSVAGNSNVILTNTPGSVGQSLNANFNFTGVLTGNIIVFWPMGFGRMFSVQNNTTGAFTLTCAVNNGSGSPDGTTVAVPQGYALSLASDGTNVTQRQNVPPPGALLTANNLSELTATEATARANIGLKNGATTTVFIQSGGPPSGGQNGDLFFIY